MAGSLSDEVRDTAAGLVALPEAKFAPALNEALRGLFPALYIDSAAIRDSAGNQTAIFETVISTMPINGGTADADAVACAACVYPILDDAKLRNAYDRIGQAKSLLKAAPTREPQSTITLGVIVAPQSSLSLPQLAEQVKVLNRTTADHLRPDMISVLSRGVILYTMRFAADRTINEWLPSQPGARQHTPAILVHLVTVATTTCALNRVVGCIAGQIVFFASQLPAWDPQALVEGVPTQHYVVATYQPNVAGTYIEIDEQAALLSPPYWIESPEGELLLKMFYQPWQDGGVIVAEGLAPLEGMLVLAQKPLLPFAMKLAGNKQISAVLPLSAAEFHVFAESIAKRSNLTLRRPPQQFTIAHMMNEGTSTPFIARLFMTPITTMRDMVLGNDKEKIGEFDRIYGAVITDLSTLRRIGKETIDLWSEHQAKVMSGQVARNQGIHIQVDETVDDRMMHNIETIIMNAADAAKIFQNLTRLFGIDIGFMYQDEKKYHKGLQNLDQADPALADYLAESRKWLQPLRLLRDELVHKPILHNRITYNRDASGSIRANEPVVMGMPVTRFIPTLLSRLYRYVEEVLTWCYQRTSQFNIGEIPIAQRDPQKPERFRFLFNAGEQPWVIIYSDDDFERV
jgi:hypothetical protein